MSSFLVTGFPGFLASNMIPRILRQRTDCEVICLVEERFMKVAETRREGLGPELRERVRLMAGDITVAGLGLADPTLVNHVSEIFHFAALYDLMLGRAAGMKVNVEGTRYTLRFAETCPQLEMFHYVSTCYVSGRYCGPFRETDLDKGQTFNNFYEETKFLAEVEVQASQVPWVVYRPSIVVGDSHSGATLKYDGPYPVIKWLLRQPTFAAVMPTLGDPARARINLVPQDYVLDALSYLSTRQRATGKVYQLADPHPLTVEDLVAELGRRTGRRLISLPVPLRLAKRALRMFPALARWSGFTPAMVDYFVHPTHYLTDQTEAALAGSGISCPSIRDVLPRLVNYVKRHPEPIG